MMDIKTIVVRRIKGFDRCVRKLGKHSLRGGKVYYSSVHVRSVLKADKSKLNYHMLELIATRSPEIFEVCDLSLDVKNWIKAYKEENKS